MLFTFTPVFLKCYGALALLLPLFLAPLAGIQETRNLYAGLPAHRDPARILLDGLAPSVSRIVVRRAFNDIASGNFSATSRPLPPVLFCTVPPPPPPPDVDVPPAFVNVTFDALRALTHSIESSPSVLEEVVRGGSRSTAVRAAIIVILGLLALFRHKVTRDFRQVVGLTTLEIKKLALQATLDDHMRDVFSKSAHIATVKARHSQQRAVLACLEHSVAALIANLETVRIDLVQVQASKELADARSNDLRQYFDVLLAREQFREELHARHVAWLDERHNSLVAQQADLNLLLLSEEAFTPLHQATTHRDIDALEASLEVANGKLLGSGAGEQKQLATIANLERDIEAEQLKNRELLQDRGNLDQFCHALRRKTLALQEEHDEKTAILETKAANAEYATIETAERTNALARQGGALQAQIDEVQATSLRTRQAHTHALATADEHITELRSETVTADADIGEVQQANNTIEARLPPLDTDADALEALADKIEADNDALESESADDEAEDGLWYDVLTAEHDDLLDERAVIGDELKIVKTSITCAQQSASSKVRAIQAEQAADAELHSSKSTALQNDIVSNDATINSLNVHHKTLKATFITDEAQYTARLAEYTMAEEQCTEDIEETMALTREAKFDLHQYESLSIEATRKQREAEDNAVKAVERAQKAQDESVATDKEMRVSRCAFSTQVKDVEAQCAELAERAEELKAEGSALNTTNAQLAAEIARQTDGFEREAAPLRAQLADADADIQVFDGVQVEVLKRMDAHIEAMQAKREQLQEDILGYGGLIDAADGAIAETVREREEEEDARSAAEGQAECLSLLVLSPGLSGAGTPQLEFASSRTPSPGISTPSPVLETPLEHEVIFDASLEELGLVEGVSLVESETVKAFVPTLPSNVGLGIVM